MLLGYEGNDKYRCYKKGETKSEYKCAYEETNKVVGLGETLNEYVIFILHANIRFYVIFHI